MNNEAWVSLHEKGNAGNELYPLSPKLSPESVAT